MVEASLIVSAVSAIIAFVGFVVSAWTFDRSSPSKVHKREQDKTMRKLATQAVLMNHNLSNVVSAAQAAELMNVKYKVGKLDQQSVSRLGRNGYKEADTWLKKERCLLAVRYEEGFSESLLRNCQALANQLNDAIEEALALDLWSVIVQLPSGLRKHAKDNRLEVPSDTFTFRLFATFRQALLEIASLDGAALCTRSFTKNHFMNGVIRMVTICKEYHEDVASTPSKSLVAALSDSNEYHVPSPEAKIQQAWSLVKHSSANASQSDDIEDARHDGDEGKAEQVLVHAGAGQPHATGRTSTASQEAGLPHDSSKNSGNSGGTGSVHVDMRDDAQPLSDSCIDRPQASPSAASTSRATQHANSEIQSLSPNQSQPYVPASVSAAPAQSLGMRPMQSGLLPIPHANASARSVHVQVAAPPSISEAPCAEADSEGATPLMSTSSQSDAAVS